MRQCSGNRKSGRKTPALQKNRRGARQTARIVTIRSLMAHNGNATQAATEQRVYRIGEVSRLTELKPFVLRYWESEFPMLEPVKSASGHRMYRQENHDRAFQIHPCPYRE